jgi:cobaltochelatase CobS
MPNNSIKANVKVEQTKKGGDIEHDMFIAFSGMQELVTKAMVAYLEKHSETIVSQKIAQHVAEEIARQKKIQINIPGRSPVEISERTHQVFEKCLFIVEHTRQLFISGPAGTGKTTLTKQIANAFGVSYGHISCSAGMSEGQLLGRMLFDGSYVESDFVRLYENGGLFLLDEIDAADSNTMLVLNSALANGYISVPNRKENPAAKRHKDFICVVAGNTWGNGSFEYHGRNHLDAAFLDRFALGRVYVDYDTELEKEICRNAPELAKKLWDIRQKVSDNRIKRVISTRAFVDGSKFYKAGLSIDEILEMLTLGWTKEEKAKVGV